MAGLFRNQPQIIKSHEKDISFILALATAAALPAFAGNSSPANSGSFYVQVDKAAGVNQTDRNVLYAYAAGYNVSVNTINVVIGNSATVKVSCPMGSRSFTVSGNSSFGGYTGSSTCVFNESITAEHTAIANGSVSLAL